tara:strand:+ start:641 stop:1024 length:384 start_codon:yes stop_codon:yes gene_type:complete
MANPSNGDIFDAINFGDTDLTNTLLKNPQAKWMQRAIASDLRTEDNESVRSITGTVEIDGQERHVILPRVRLDSITGKLVKLSEEDAWKTAFQNKDFIFADSQAEADFISKGFSNWQGKKEQDNAEY